MESSFYPHLANSVIYKAITGHHPPHKPPSAKDYSRAGLPWFDYYSDGKALPGSGVPGKLTSLAAKVIEKGQFIDLHLKLTQDLHRNLNHHRQAYKACRI